jgi:hypothetical protein
MRDRWQSMETAPKDGRTVLVTFKETPEGDTFTNSETFVRWYVPFRGEGIWLDQEGNVCRPRYWMPA